MFQYSFCFNTLGKKSTVRETSLYTPEKKVKLLSTVLDILNP